MYAKKMGLARRVPETRHEVDAYRRGSQRKTNAMDGLAFEMLVV